MTHAERKRHDLFLLLYMQHEDALHAFVRTLVPTREDACEVMQEVAAVLWRKFDELASPQDFSRWAFGVARFEVLAFRRDRARNRQVLDNDVLEQIADETASAADSLDAEREALDQCLGKLPPEHRSLVDAAYARGTRIDVLATRMGRTAMSLYKSLHRIRMMLAACITRTLAQERQG